MKFVVCGPSLSKEETLYVKNSASQVKPLYEYTKASTAFFSSFKKSDPDTFNFYKPILCTPLFSISRPKLKTINSVILSKLYIFNNISKFNDFLKNILISTKIFQRYYTINFEDSIDAIPWKHLKIKEIHKVSTGKNVTIGILDDSSIDNVNISTYSLIDTKNDRPFHGKKITKIITSICPQSTVIFIELPKYNQGNNAIYLILGIIACILKKCDIINISRVTEFNESDFKFISEVFSNFSKLINLPIIISSGNNARSIRSGFASFNKYFITVGGYDINDNNKKIGSNGNEIDVYMPANYTSVGTSYSAAYFTSIISNYLNYIGDININLTKIHTIIKNNLILIQSSSKQKLFSINIINLFTMSNINKLVKRNRNDNNLGYLFLGQITSVPKGLNPGQVKVISPTPPTGQNITFPFSRGRDLRKEDYVYFLVGNFEEQEIAVCLTRCNNNFNIDQLCLYLPEEMGSPSGGGTVTDTRPPGNPLITTSNQYFVITHLDNGIPKIYECYSNNNYEPFDVIEFNDENAQPFPIIRHCGIWSV